MSLIQPFDGSILIKSYRAGRRDRIADDEADIKRRKGESELATEEEYRGLAGQLIPRGGGVLGQYGVNSRGGVAHQYAGGGTSKQPLQIGETNPPLLDNSSPLPPRQRETVEALSAAVDSGGAPPAPPSASSVAPTTAPEPPVERSMRVTTRISFGA